MERVFSAAGLTTDSRERMTFPHMVRDTKVRFNYNALRPQLTLTFVSLGSASTGLPDLFFTESNWCLLTFPRYEVCL